MKKIVFFLYVTLFAFSIKAGLLHAISLSQFSNYPQYCLLAAQNPYEFAHFKRNPVYRMILEHVTQEQGFEYLKVLEEDYPSILEQVDLCRLNDVIGDPETYTYGKYGDFSPTTLRYMKVTGDLMASFKNLKDKHIVEIGAGYGGQCLLLHLLSGFASYTIIDLPESNELIKKYLAAHGVQNVYFISSTDVNNVSFPKYDLLISNYAFTEISKDEQKIYMKKLIKHVPKGYMTCNFISSLLGVDSYSLDELINFLFRNDYRGVAKPERPLTTPGNMLLIWKEAYNPLSAATSQPYPTIPFSPAALQTSSAVTYAMSNVSRLGDCAMAYLHAKWIAYKQHLPFIYVPFPHSDAFKLHGQEIQRNPSFIFDNELLVRDLHAVNFQEKSTLYTIPYAAECKYQYKIEKDEWKLNLPKVDVDWDDPVFRQEVGRCFNPVRPIPRMSLPKRYITVALHVRRGGGVDRADIQTIHPLKFPPDSYYIDQIKRLFNFFNKRAMYVYIFTDDLHPEAIAQTFKASLEGLPIVWGFRANDNSPHSNIIEDLIGMTQFDCLIFCGSNLSILASKLTQHKVLISPAHAYWMNGQCFIDETELHFNPPS